MLHRYRAPPPWRMGPSNPAGVRRPLPKPGLCLILSVEEYDSSFGPLRPYLYRQLQEELRNNREYPRAEQEEYRGQPMCWYPQRIFPMRSGWNTGGLGFGGSDAAVVCGISRYKSPVELWMEKTGQLPSQETGGGGLLGQFAGIPGAGGIYQAHGDSRDKAQRPLPERGTPFSCWPM